MPEQRIYIPPKHRRRRDPLDDYHPDVMLGSVLLGCIAAVILFGIWWLFHR